MQSAAIQYHLQGSNIEREGRERRPRCNQAISAQVTRQTLRILWLESSLSTYEAA